MRKSLTTLVLAISVGLGGCSAASSAPTEVEPLITTAVSETMEEGESSEVDVSEGTEATADISLGTPTPIPTQAPPPSPLRSILTVTTAGLNEYYRIPQIIGDSDEITALNASLIDTASERDYSYINFSVYSSADGIISIVIDYAGKYSAYTINYYDGHILSGSEILELAGITEEEFLDSAREGTIIYLNDNYTWEDRPVIIDGEINPLWASAMVFDEYTDSVNANFSAIGTDMPMIIDTNGNICIFQKFFTNTEAFIAIGTGSAPEGNIPTNALPVEG